MTSCTFPSLVRCVFSLELVNDWSSNMHVRWKGLELPASVKLEDNSATDTFGRFTVEPFERGFGTTIGNSIRRILLSSIEGAAITSIRVKGADHEFCTLSGVVQDMVDIVLNVKGLVIELDSEEEKILRLKASGPGEVTADLIEGRKTEIDLEGMTLDTL